MNTCFFSRKTRDSINSGQVLKAKGRLPFFVVRLAQHQLGVTMPAERVEAAVAQVLDAFEEEEERLKEWVEKIAQDSAKAMQRIAEISLDVFAKHPPLRLDMFVWPLVLKQVTEALGAECAGVTPPYYLIMSLPRSFC